MCRWDSTTSTCSMKCENLYDSAGTCNADTKCMWNANTGSCVANCAVISSQPECISLNLYCRWDQTTSTCAKQCQYRYNTSAGCNNDAECDWYNGACTVRCSRLSSQNLCVGSAQCAFQAASGQCRKSCDLSSPSECSANSWCDLMADGSCVTRCLVKYQTQTVCNGDVNCLWDATSSVCTRSCDAIYQLAEANVSTSALSALCTAQPMCRFNGTNPSVVQQCSTKCSYSFTISGACNADPNCLWDNVNQKCSADCDQQTSQAGCLASAMCQWG